METRQDPEFGLMTPYSDSWIVERRATLGGVPVPIIVEPNDESSFEPQQRQAVRLALALGASALEEAAGAVVQNYQVYREAIGDDEQLPPLESPSDVWQQVRIDHVWVPLHGEARHAYFLIQAECDWDMEHGLEVRFRDGIAIESNQALQSHGAQDDSPEYLEELRQLIADALATCSQPID